MLMPLGFWHDFRRQGRRKLLTVEKRKLACAAKSILTIHTIASLAVTLKAAAIDCLF